MTDILGSGALKELLSAKVGEEISLEQGKLAARGVAIELLAVLKAVVGDLDNVRRIVKLFVIVNGAPNFTEPHRVADGASELLVQVFGERASMRAVPLVWRRCHSAHASKLT